MQFNPLRAAASAGQCLAGSVTAVIAAVRVVAEDASRARASSAPGVRTAQNYHFLFPPHSPPAGALLDGDALQDVGAPPSTPPHTQRTAPTPHTLARARTHARAHARSLTRSLARTHPTTHARTTHARTHNTRTHARTHARITHTTHTHTLMHTRRYTRVHARMLTHTRSLTHARMQNTRTCARCARARTNACTNAAHTHTHTHTHIHTHTYTHGSVPFQFGRNIHVCVCPCKPRTSASRRPL